MPGHALHQPGKAQQHLRTAPVEIHLIGAKGGPDLTRTNGAPQLREQIGTARTNNIRPAGIRGCLEHTGAAGLLIAHELLHPGVRGRHVIQNQIGHQPSALGQGSKVAPIAETRLEPRVAGHRKTTITGGLQKRQHMNHRCEGLQMAIHKRFERLKPRSTLLTNGVGVGDQDRIATVPAIDVFCHIAIS